MLLAIDIGNSRIKTGVFDDESGSHPYVPSTISRTRYDRGLTDDEYGFLVSDLLLGLEKELEDVSSVVICSGVPSMTTTFVELCESYFGRSPLIVGAGLETGVKSLYENPADVGADRLANAAAAYKLYGGPAIVVDMGTATVFDAITKSGEYLGGAIAPGLFVAADALFRSASQLDCTVLEYPSRVIGGNTLQALQSGLVLGHAEMVKGLVQRFDCELGGESNVIATGGAAYLIAYGATVFDDVKEELTMAGLKVIKELNEQF